MVGGEEVKEAEEEEEEEVRTGKMERREAI